MKKILLLMLLVLLPVSVQAESNISATVSEDTVSIDVELSKDNRSQPVSLQVYAENGILNFADILYRDKEGKVSVEYKNEGATGTYTCKVYSDSASDEENPEQAQTTFDFFDTTYRKTMITDFNDLVQNSGSLTLYAEKYKKALGIENAIRFLTIDETGKNLTFDSLAPNSTVVVENTEQIKKYIKAAVFASVARETKSSEKMKEILNSPAFSDYLNFATYNGKPLLSELNNDIQSKFYSKISQTTAVGDENVKNEIKIALITSAAEHAALTSELEKVLDVYSQNSWINLSGSVDKSGATASLVGGKFDTIEAIETKYNSYIAPAPGNGEGNTTGSSSSGSKKNNSSGGHVSTLPSSTVQGTILEQKQLFSDVELTMWAAENIRKAVEAGILTGVGDGKFEPSGELTRAQTAVILCKMAGISESDSMKDFSDVRPEDWYSGYVNAVVDKGLFFGISETEFGANISLTREQAAAVFWRYLQSKGFAAKEQTMTFDDDAEISDWAKESVYSLVSLGIISGKTDKLFCPKKSLLRSEAAVIINGILEKTAEGSVVND